jgi:hypothetical protein
VGAERLAAGAVAAEGAVGLGGDRVAPFEDALGQVGQLLGERGDVLRREGGGDGRVGALEEGVGDLDGGGAVAQRGKRVDDPLGGVVALDDLLRVLLADPVGLVVDDERGAVGRLGQDVDEAIDERALRGVEREREPGLAADRGCGGDASAQRRGAERDDDLPDVLEVLRSEVRALLGGEEQDGSGGSGRVKSSSSSRRWAMTPRTRGSSPPAVLVSRENGGSTGESLRVRSR